MCLKHIFFRNTEKRQKRHLTQHHFRNCKHCNRKATTNKQATPSKKSRMMCVTTAPTRLTADPATCSALNEFQMHHAALRLDVDMTTRTIAGEAQLHMRRAPGSSSHVLQLDVFHLHVHSVRVRPAPQSHESGSGGGELLDAIWAVKPFTSFGDALEIAVPQELQDENEFVFTIKYDTDSESPGVCWLAKEQTAGKLLPYMYTQGQEVLNRSFFPCQDSPSVRVTYSASVIVPAELVCVMSAKLCSVDTGVAKSSSATGARTRYNFEMQQSIPVYLVAMAVGDLASADVGPRSTIWTEPCMIEASKHEFEGVIEKYIRTGEELFGEYQWERYDVLVMPPSFPYGGMENPRLTFVSPSLIVGDQSLSSGTPTTRYGCVLLL